MTPRTIEAEQALRDADHALSHLDAEGIGLDGGCSECRRAILILTVLRNALARTIEQRSARRRREPILKGSR